jgi:hypothetical protein
MNCVYFFVITLFAIHAHAASSAEMTCRSQAKEIAVQTYSSCITQARNTQIDDIRKNYKEELAALKSKYDQELKKMGGAKAEAAAQKMSEKSGKKKGSALTLKEISAQKPTKGIAHKLPSKSGHQEAMPIQNVTDGAKVVTANDSSSDSSVEKEAAQSDGIEVIEMPVDETPAT